MLISYAIKKFFFSWITVYCTFGCLLAAPVTANATNVKNLSGTRSLEIKTAKKIFHKKIYQTGYHIEPIRIAASEWPPYLSEQYADLGVLSRIVTAAFKQVNREVKYGFFPWHLSLLLTKTGIWQGSLAWTQDSSRKNTYFFSDPIFESQEVLFYINDHTINWDTLSSYRVGATGGYYNSHAVNQLKAHGFIDVILAESDRRNFTKLFRGDLDFFVHDKTSAWFILAEKFSKAENSRVTFSPKVIRTNRFHLILNKHRNHHQQVIDEFNLGLKKLKETENLENWFQAAKAFNRPTESSRVN